jgi:hypothetical protein
MLKFAKKYEEELKRIYFETAFGDSFKWVWLGTCREWYAP